MSTISILLVVDVEGALVSNDLQSNVYLLDTTEHSGSFGDGKPLSTICHPLDTIQWSVTPIAPQNSVSIHSFGGLAIHDKICVPTQKDAAADSVYWHGIVKKPTSVPPPSTGQPSDIVQAPGSASTYPYTIILNFEDETMSLALNLVVK